VPYYLEQANRLFNEYPEVDGVFGVDLQACAALKVAEQKKLPVPERLKIVGCDGTAFSVVASRTFTTVMQPIPDLAAYAVNAVTGLIEGRPAVKDEIVLDVYLREGETA